VEFKTWVNKKVSRNWKCVPVSNIWMNIEAKFLKNWKNSVSNECLLSWIGKGQKLNQLKDQMAIGRNDTNGFYRGMRKTNLVCWATKFVSPGAYLRIFTVNAYEYRVLEKSAMYTLSAKINTC